MYLDLSCTAALIECSFGQMFFGGSSGFFSIEVKEEQTFRKIAIVKTFGIEQILHHRLVFFGSYEFGHCAPSIAQACLVKGVIECKSSKVCKERLLCIRSWLIVIGIEEVVQILEHARSSTGCRYKLDNVAVRTIQISVPFQQISGFVIFIQTHDSIL